MRAPLEDEIANIQSKNRDRLQMIEDRKNSTRLAEKRCDVLQEKLEDIEDITNGFVAGGIYLGVEDMNSPFFDISETEFVSRINVNYVLQYRMKET